MFTAILTHVLAELNIHDISWHFSYSKISKISGIKASTKLKLYWVTQMVLIKNNFRGGAVDSVLLGGNIYATTNLFPNYSLRQKPQSLIIVTELLHGILAGFTKPALDYSRMSSDFCMKLLDLSPEAQIPK